MPCKTVKKTPKRIVLRSPSVEFVFKPQRIEKCAHVTVIPELRRTMVFKRGIEKGFKAQTPWGGQVVPISKVGAKLL